MELCGQIGLAAAIAVVIGESIALGKAVQITVAESLLL